METKNCSNTLKNFNQNLLELNILRIKLLKMCPSCRMLIEKRKVAHKTLWKQFRISIRTFWRCII